MSQLEEYRFLFSLLPHAAMPAPKVSTRFHPSSIAFLESVQRPKSEMLKRFVSQNGWPDNLSHGVDMQEKAFAIIHYCDYDVEFQKLCHGLMIESAALGTTALGFVAFMTDRILCNEGRHQRFGTQIRETDNGSFVPKAMEDAERVDELREQVGLIENLSDYFARVNTGDVLLHRFLLTNPPPDEVPAPKVRIEPAQEEKPREAQILQFPAKSEPE
jgi:hypothetical protein